MQCRVCVVSLNCDSELMNSLDNLLNTIEWSELIYSCIISRVEIDKLDDLLIGHEYPRFKSSKQGLFYLACICLDIPG